jgi:FkbM family methyltransferase
VTQPTLSNDRFAELRLHALIRVTRVITRVLRVLRVRDPLLAWRRRQRRARRLAAEALGEDRLSRPAAFELERKLDAIIDRDGGFFVEAGANDGFAQSNTYWLERFRGWRGLLVEPMPQLAHEARISRPDAAVFECALVPAEHSQATVHMRFGDLMSTVDGVRSPNWAKTGVVLGWFDAYETDVPARTLSSLLDEIGAPEVDLLSLDVEGFEGPALRGLDLARHAPRYVLVEIHDAEREQAAIDALLGERYTEHGWLSPIDLLYVRRDVATERSGAADGDA